jgi:hypothetical protein
LVDQFWTALLLRLRLFAAGSSGGWDVGDVSREYPGNDRRYPIVFFFTNLFFAWWDALAFGLCCVLE